MSGETIVYTDGACLGNPGPGGWAWAVPDGAFAAGAEARTTNQRMELTAALEAVRHFDTGPLEIVSDSTYVVNCFRDRWWEGWIERGWRNKAKQPVANRDLWEPLVAAVRADVGRVRFRWVKGHAEDPMNDLVDRLAVQAATTQTARIGTGRPDDLGPADRPSKAAGGAASATSAVVPPDGHLLAALGHRPPALGGYAANPVADRVRRRLAEILEAKRSMHDDLVVLSGLGLGAEQLAAEAATAAKVPYVAVLAFPDQDAVWSADARRRYQELLDGAADRLLLQRRRPETKQAAAGALARRDAWLGRHAHEAVVVWDGHDPILGRVVRSLRDHLGDDVWVLEPGA